MQVPPKSRAALQVNEARLALLLQAERTSLQLPASAHSFRLAAVDITSHLARCQVSLLGPAADVLVSAFIACACLLAVPLQMSEWKAQPIQVQQEPSRLMKHESQVHK